ncbi:cobalt ECF transporter T component CbiQ [Aneurinibacillus sp. REN35]|uniref:cobalt ECF transporter T component CbiQ n=1 Tax=Aneurinibacillus sp. REN35 TaxID=3237286 RepID=UPI0035274C8A
MKIQLDAIAYTNRLRHIYPAQKVGFGLCMLLFVLLSHTLVHAAVFMWMSAWIVLRAGISGRVYVRLLGAVTLFLMLGLPPLVVEISAAPPTDTVLFQFSAASWHIYGSREGVEKAGMLLIRSLASVSCLYFILLTVPFTELLTVLRRVKVPVLLTDLLLVMYRFVFVFLETAEQLWTAQQARSGSGRFRKKIRDAGFLIVRLFTRTFQRYQQLSIGLAARGFTGDLRVISTASFSGAGRYGVEAVVGFVLLVALEWWTRR